MTCSRLLLPWFFPLKMRVSRVISMTDLTWAQQRVSASALTHRMLRFSCRERLWLSSLEAVTHSTGGSCSGSSGTESRPEGGKDRGGAVWQASGGKDEELGVVAFDGDEEVCAVVLVSLAEGFLAGVEGI